VDQIEAGQSWVARDGSGDKLRINGPVGGGKAGDWDVTVLPSGVRLMKTTESIVADYRPA
jgi:hypothetical protein